MIDSIEKSFQIEVDHPSVAFARQRCFDQFPLCYVALQGILRFRTFGRAVKTALLTLPDIVGARRVNGAFASSCRSPPAIKTSIMS
jgi:hypothetical protein